MLTSFHSREVILIISYIPLPIQVSEAETSQLLLELMKKRHQLAKAIPSTVSCCQQVRACNVTFRLHTAQWSRRCCRIPQANVGKKLQNFLFLYADIQVVRNCTNIQRRSIFRHPRFSFVYSYPIIIIFYYRLSLRFGSIPVQFSILSLSLFLSFFIVFL